METEWSKIGFGGGCHWCTEAVFLSLRGVQKVQQGFIAPKNAPNAFSEAVIVNYQPQEITISTLIAIHLHTHKSTSEHSMRTKYRSAIYVFNAKDEAGSKEALQLLQKDFLEQIITQVLYFDTFKSSLPQYHNYYFTNPNKPFCETYIAPKLQVLLRKFAKEVDNDKVNAHH